MKGLDLAERFFLEYGLPALQDHYPELTDRVSAGLIGRGSEVLGADDAFSHDHGWGPRFCLFVPEQDRDLIQKVCLELNALRPAQFRGIDLAEHRTEPITVSTVDDCYRDLTGSPWPPACVQEWAFVDENGLCFAQAGRVFYDPCGQLTTRKRAFARAYYPDPVWKWRIASQLYRLWHYGDYNLRGRLLQRNDGTAALIGQGVFVEAAMQLAFTLNRRFAPYWKWLHWSFLRLPTVADRLGPLLASLVAASDLGARADLVRAICELYRGELCDRGIFPDRNWRNFMGAFEIVDGIRDPEVKALVEDHFGRYKRL